VSVFFAAEFGGMWKKRDSFCPNLTFLFYYKQGNVNL